MRTPHFLLKRRIAQPCSFLLYIQQPVHFVMDQDTADSPAIRHPVPRLYHKKSRLGCLRCKGRRVKCDERRPVCSGCARHDVECVYPTEAAGSSERAVPRRRRAAEPSGYAANATGGAGAGADGDDGDDDDADTMPESRGRRMTELRLLYHYLLTHGRTFGHALGVTSPNGYMWSSDLVRQALADEEPPDADADADADNNEKHDGILYALLAHAALGVWMGTDPTASAARRAQHRHLHQQYLSKALRAQRRAVDDLVLVSVRSETAKRALADNVGSAALLLVNHSFALVQTLPVAPWQPPHEWLQMGRGAMQVMEVAKEYLDLGVVTRPGGSAQTPIAREPEAPPSLVLRIVQSPPFFDPSDMFAPVWAAPFLGLLDEPSDPPHPDEPEIDERHRYQDRSVPGLYTPDRARHSASSVAMRAYYETLAYIGWCAAAAERRDEPVHAICRRLAAAAFWFPREFEERLGERRPRALVCLAQFFALWIPFEFTGRFESSSFSGSTSSSSHRPVWMMGTAGRRQVAAIHAALPARRKSKVAPLLG